MFFQNRVEVRKENKYFIRAYSTNEDAGNSYDAVYTAILMQNGAKTDDQWGKDYRKYWTTNDLFTRAHALPGFPPYQAPYDTAQANSVLAQYNDTVVAWHNGAEAYANTASLNYKDFYESGTYRFDSLLESVTSRKTFKEGGSGFYDKSALYHMQGEYKFTPSFAEIITGASYRLYKPDSRGTIFSDTSGERITDYEYGIYAGITKTISVNKKYQNNFSGIVKSEVTDSDQVIFNFTIRMDKNKNFDYLFSPALSAVYTYKHNHTFRVSFSSAIRNPTLADQYLYYNVGRAILLGNISGYQDLITVESFRAYLNTPLLDKSKLVYFDVDPVKPEKVQTIEVGYRATVLKNVYVDANYYFSYYHDFIGYRIGLDVAFDAQNQNYFNSLQAYRIASNSKDMVISQGGSIGINYYFYKHYALIANYSYNKLDRRGSADPLIPAFNTPENKYNIGVNARDVAFRFFGMQVNSIGFNVNYKWIQGFLFEGSPQFTGKVDSYGLVDAQVNYFAKRIKSTFKLGASNVLNDKIYQVYGGPEVGRLAYFGINVNLTQ
jgi:iron complex outermembrane receptor protein